MSTFNRKVSTNRQATTNYDVSKMFVWNNRYHTENEINNSSYIPLNCPGGLLVGRVTSSGLLAPFNSAANDGTQFPVGVLKADVGPLAALATAKCAICVMGDVVAEQIIFAYSGDGLDTIVSAKRVRDYIQQMGINLVSGTSEQTQYDN